MATDRRIEAEKLYVITGENKLTRERVTVSKAMLEQQAKQLRKDLALRQHRYSAYRKLKVEPALTEGKLF